MNGPSPVGGLQRRLALEHEAVWTTSLVAGRFEALRDAATDSLTTHRRVRDALLERIAVAGATPVGPQATYGEPPATADDARARLATLARRLCTATVPLVTAGSADDRREALAALRASALEAIDWGADVQAFPGLDRA